MNNKLSAVIISGEGDYGHVRFLHVASERGLRRALSKVPTGSWASAWLYLHDSGNGAVYRNIDTQEMRHFAFSSVTN